MQGFRYCRPQTMSEQSSVHFLPAWGADGWMPLGCVHAGPGMAWASPSMELPAHALLSAVCTCGGDGDRTCVSL